MSEYLGFEPSKNPIYFFISYNSEDRNAIRDIAKTMMHSGINLWYDFGIDYGDKWEATITQKIKDSQGVVLFFTKGILLKNDSYVHKEYKIAKFLNRKIYVVLIDKISAEDIPVGKISWWIDICDNQTVNLFEASDIYVMVERLSMLLGVQTQKDRMNMIISAYNALYFEGRIDEADNVLAEYLHKVSLKGKTEIIANIVSGGFQKASILSPTQDIGHLKHPLRTHTGDERYSFTECKQITIKGDIFTVGNGFVFHRGRRGDADVIWIWKNGELIHTVGGLIEASDLAVYWDSVDNIIYTVYSSEEEENLENGHYIVSRWLGMITIENPNEMANCTDFHFIRLIRRYEEEDDGYYR